jgi:hypothetical protein
MIELLVLGGTLTLAAWAAGAQAHRRSSASRALDRYAQSRGGIFVPAPESPKGASPRVVGYKDGIEYAVDLYRLYGEVRTRVSAMVVRGRSPEISVAQRRAFWIRREATVQLGEADFDDAFLVTAGVAADAECLRETKTSLLLLDHRRSGVWLRSDGHKIALSWIGMESDPVILDAARDVVLTMAASHRPKLPYR